MLVFLEEGYIDHYLIKSIPTFAPYLTGKSKPYYKKRLRWNETIHTQTNEAAEASASAW